MPSSIRCFKSFFKHTWHPQQMDDTARINSGKREVAGSETELGEVKVNVSTSSLASPVSSSDSRIPCKNGGCKSSSSRAEPRAESPWHVLKTVFLVSVIVALLIWVIVYTLLAQYRIV